MFKLFSLFIVLFSFEAKALTTVLLVGDSITRSFTNGGGSVSGTGFIETDVGSYSIGLTDSLGPDYSVINVGCSGSRSYQWTPGWVVPLNNTCNGVPVINNLFLDYVVDVDIATVMLGTNDAFLLNPSASYKTSMVQVVNGLFNSGASAVILMTAPPLPGATVAKNTLLAEYRLAVLDICNTMSNVYCIDTNTLLSDISVNFTGVTAHPNAVGHEVIREALHNQIIAIPEPGSLTLLIAGIVGLAFLNKLLR